MVAPTVPFCTDAVKNGRVALNVFSDTEKCGLLLCFGQHVEDAWCPLRVWSVIKCEVQCTVLR